MSVEKKDSQPNSRKKSFEIMENILLKVNFVVGCWITF